MDIEYKPNISKQLVLNIWANQNFRTTCFKEKLVTYKSCLEACKFAKINTPTWVFFTFFKLYKWYQIAQCTTFVTEAASRRCTVKKVFLKITQYLQEKICVGVSF